MPARRRALALGIVVVGLGAVSACEKPAPYVTVVSGTTSASARAACYAHTGTVDVACGGLARAPVLPVTAGDRVGVSVDSSMLPGGWYVAAQQGRSRPISDYYFAFQVGDADLRGGDMVLRVVDLGRQQRPKGVWVFRLRPR
jgi:hypothetical protein